MKIKYRTIKLSAANKLRLDMINKIIVEYQNQGYRLTLRQLYYQLVSRDVIPNVQKEYANLSKLLKEGRMAGIVDWDAIEDRLRKPNKPSCWDSPQDILEACANQFRFDRMKNQPTYIEVWVEKDALSGVLKRVTEKYGINIVVNRGYSSVTAMHDAHLRFSDAWRDYYEEDKNRQVTILYLGDFDPSGQDMIRDVEDRILEFRDNDGVDYDFVIFPVALTTEQIRKYNPPPNPAKTTDPRSGKFIDQHGSVSYEVDALRPEVLNDLLDIAIRDNLDDTEYDQMLEKEVKARMKLQKIADKN